MKIKTVLLFFICLFITSCGVKETRNLISYGNYDEAIDMAINGLRNNKDAKGKQDYVYLLEESFAKAKQRDKELIASLELENSVHNSEKIYNTYLLLHERQEKIKPILPLKLIKQNRNAIFTFDNYSQKIIDAKNNLANYLYLNAKNLLNTNNKLNFRLAYDDLLYLNKISPNYKDVLVLLQDAKEKGTDFVYVFTNNETNMIIPVQLQKDLLDFSTFGLNDFWTVYHSNKQKSTAYDFSLLVNFRQINISPEQIREKEFIKEKLIKDGTKPLLNEQGNPVKDSLGNTIMVDNMKTVRATIYEFKQLKTCAITAKVDYLENKTNQLIETFPLQSEFLFEHIYATYNGDKRACDTDYLSYFDNRVMPFPSNEQMVYDCGEDLKSRLKNIIIRNKFRR